MMDMENPTPASPRAPLGLMIGGAALLFVVLFGGAYLTIRPGLASSRPAPGGAEEQNWPPDSQSDDDYTKWQKPLFAIVVSGQMHGYTDPCGCSSPQYGGLTRRYNFIQSLKEKKWDVVGIDLGELPQLKGIQRQNLLKYEMSVRALAAMNYKVMGIGRDEILFPLGDLLPEIADERIRYPRPINVSLAEAAPGKKLNEFNLRPYEIIDTVKPKIGVINVIGTDLRDELKDREKFLSNMTELPKALDAFAKAGVEIGIVLHHEYPRIDDEGKFPKGGIQRLKEVERIREDQARKIAEFCGKMRDKNRKMPPIQLMMMLTEEPEPPSFTKELNKTTQAIEIGHKGKYVGLVGVYGDKKNGYRVQYQKVLMSPDWETKEGKEKDNAVTVLKEKYNKELERQNVLAMALRTPHYNQTDTRKPGLTAKYVGSNRCKTCHPDAFKVWSATKHQHGTDRLEELKFPSGRQHDPECMKCHTTGFEHPGGYNDPIEDLAKWTPNKKQAINLDDLNAHNKKLRGVGCESCHGPASEHVKVAGDRVLTPEEIKRINPYRPTDEERELEGVVNKNALQKKRFDDLNSRRMDALSNLCLKCHDSENDVHFLNVGVVERWLGGKNPVVHRTPAPKNNNGHGKGPGVQKDGPPPIVIEIFEEKKK